MNISKAKIKLIHSLDSKKGRRESGLFIAEGPKVVGDLLELMPARLIIATTDWLEDNNDRINDTETIEVSDEELKKLPCFNTLKRSWRCSLSQTTWRRTTVISLHF